MGVGADRAIEGSCGSSLSSAQASWKRVRPIPRTIRRCSVDGAPTSKSHWSDLDGDRRPSRDWQPPRQSDDRLSDRTPSGWNGLRRPPVSARPVRASGSSRTGYWLIALSPTADEDEVWSALERTLAEGRAADAQLLARAQLLQEQPGLDMHYPLRGGMHEPRWRWLEYAVPEAGSPSPPVNDVRR